MTETPETPGAPGPPGRRATAAAAPSTAAGGGGSAADYPVHLDIEHQEEYSRFMPLIKWLLAIPHYIVLLVLGIGALFVVIISFFAVLFTGRYPRGDVRLHGRRPPLGAEGRARTRYLMVDPYPPFTLDDDPSYPVQFDIDYPEHVDRWRPLVHWLLVIPYAIVAVPRLSTSAEILVFFAFFTILFTKQFPEGMFNIVRISAAVAGAGNAYELLAGRPGTRRSSGTEQLTQAERGGGPSGARLAFGGATRPAP